MPGLSRSAFTVYENGAPQPITFFESADIPVTVGLVRVVSPRDLSVLDPTPEPTLTLVTCFPSRYIGSAPERFIVRADLAAPETARAATR